MLTKTRTSLLDHSHNQNDFESQIRYYSRRFQTCYVRECGSLLFDNTGVQFVDFLSGAGALNYGHNEPVLKKYLLDYIQQDGIVQTLDMRSDAKENLLVVLNELILRPRSLNYVAAFPGPTGTNAVELALKFARNVTGRSLIASFSGSFHGVSVGSLAATSSAYHRQAAGVPLRDVVFLPFEATNVNDEINELTERVLVDLTKSDELPAAIIIETVQGDGGVNVGSAGWLRYIRDLAHELGALLIVDDIQAGCGRTGPFFSFERADIIPDIVCLSKSLSGYGLPLSLVLLRPELDILKPGSHNGTFRGFAPAFVTATAALERYWSDDTLHSEVIRKGEIMSERLSTIAAIAGGQVKGIGMFKGIEFQEPHIADIIAINAFKNQLIIETCGSLNSVVKLLPALNISDELLHTGLDILERSVYAATTNF